MQRRSTKLRYILVLLVICPLTLGSCGKAMPTVRPAATATPDIGNIRVERAEAVRTVVGTDDFPLPNCGGTSKLSQSLGAEATVQRSVTIGDKASTTAGAEAEIPMTVKAKLEVEIELAYQETYQVTRSRLYEITMEAAPGTHVVYVIAWEEQKFASTVSYAMTDEVYKAPYTYTLQVPKIGDSYQVDCPPPTVTTTQALTPTETLTPTPTRTFTPTPTTPTRFTYPVRVQEQGTGQNIPNAKVIIEVVGQAPLDEITDTDGFARIFIDASYVGKPGRLLVEANGYKPCRQEIDLREGILPDTIQLEPKLADETPSPTLTLMSIPTSTPTLTPTETLTPTPIPLTSTPTPMSTITPTRPPPPVPPSETPSVTPPTSLSTSTPTPVPPMATPVPPTPTPTYPAPTLKSPPNGAPLFFCWLDNKLEWQYGGEELKDDEHFDVRVWREGEPHYAITWTTKEYHPIGCQDLPSGKYYWSIAVIRGRDRKWEQDLSLESEVRVFHWWRPSALATPTPTPTPR